MTAKLFETALGIGEPWSVSRVDFDEASKVLSILVDFSLAAGLKSLAMKACIRCTIPWPRRTGT